MRKQAHNSSVTVEALRDVDGKHKVLNEGRSNARCLPALRPTGSRSEPAPRQLNPPGSVQMLPSHDSRFGHLFQLIRCFRPRHRLIDRSRNNVGPLVIWSANVITNGGDRSQTHSVSGDTPSLFEGPENGCSIHTNCASADSGWSLPGVLAQPKPAVADDRGSLPLMAQACVAGHRFDPGPIVEGHNRQPTPREFQARMQELKEWEQKSSGNCSWPPVANEAVIPAPSTAPAPDQIARRTWRPDR